MSYSVVYQDIGIKDYKETWDYQEQVFNKLVSRKTGHDNLPEEADKTSTGTLIFVQHPHVYTLGKSGSEKNLLVDYIQLQAKDAKFYRTDRGGDITYHGPGQIVGYPIFDLEVLKISLRDYIFRLEEALILLLSDFGLKASRISGATGVWLDCNNKNTARKICAIGVKASRYVTMHGFAFNVNTDLEYFKYINPCGFTDKGVTSLEKALGIKQDIENIKLQLKEKLGNIFDLKWI
ncbi:MAG: lipoyl(octanoyl) transferase LipB [Bacteroidales bacterium]|nr:lipoyl(octanoyl) transferase LipB [Bacteroidales bacterium]